MVHSKVSNNFTLRLFFYLGMTEHFFEECIPELLVFDEIDDFENVYQ